MNSPRKGLVIHTNERRHNSVMILLQSLKTLDLYLKEEVFDRSLIKLRGELVVSISRN